MADDKFDPDKTMVDIPAPAKPAGGPGSAPDRTILAERPSSPPAPPSSGDRTIVRGPSSARPPVDSDRTMIQATGGAASSPPGANAGATHELVGLSGAVRGRRYPVGAGEVRIGSGTGNAIVVPGLAALHARIVKSAAGHEIENLAAPDSVVLQGGRRAAKSPVAPGELVKIGDVVFRFVAAGEVFSSEFKESAFEATAMTRLLDLGSPRTRILLGAIAALVLAFFLFPGGEAGPARKATKAKKAAVSERQAEIESLLSAGETLLGAGKFLAPSDQPDAENAFAKFNDVLALDPGNAKALDGLRRIDAERERLRTAREEAERARKAAEDARRERARQELAARIASILAEGDGYYDRGQVAEPAGQNALAKYREALELDPESQETRERVRRAVDFYVERGDAARDADDPWTALENYRKASRATEGKAEDIEARVHEVEATLKSGMAASGNRLIMYKDERGRLFVLDDMEKVPLRYRDRAVEVTPGDQRSSQGVRRSGSR